jgi:hypothetical protein
LVKSALFSLNSCISCIPRLNSAPVSVKRDILCFGKSVNFQTNPYIQNINTKSRHHLHIISYHSQSKCQPPLFSTKYILRWHKKNAAF